MGQGNHGLTRIDTNKDGKPSKLLLKDLTQEIIGAAFEVHNTLGCGLLEKVYENALGCELKSRGQRAVAQKEYVVKYRDWTVGTYYADLVVGDSVIVEVKACDSITDVHRAQLLNYLRISGLRVGLLMNFAKPRLVYERLVR